MTFLDHDDAVVSCDVTSGVMVVVIANPPVNALSHAVRLELIDSFARVQSEPGVHAVVILCQGRTFSAGADIREFTAAPKSPHLPQVVDAIEACAVPVIAAIHGTALGGGLELALGAHYRIAERTAKMGLPEVNLGLLPGAGGTQRLPRLIGVEAAAQVMTGGDPVLAKDAKELGLIDLIVEPGRLKQAAISFAQDLIVTGTSVRPTREMTCEVLEKTRWEVLKSSVATRAKGSTAPLACLDALDAAMHGSFEAGLAQERALFGQLKSSDQHRALRYAFLAEREVGKVPMITGVAPRGLDQIGVIGGGTMGVGIAASALMAGLGVRLIEVSEDAAHRAEVAVARVLDGAVKRWKLSPQQLDEILEHRFGSDVEYAGLADADLVIEAAFESMDVKREIFSQLDAICKPGAILASNTSYLDINEIARTTNRPSDVLGLHFFSPAHVMRLLEVVVGDTTSADAVATGFALAKRMKKIAVRAGVCDGFIGNRILSHYQKAINGAVLHGASPYDVDQALKRFGLAMGPFAVSDLAGLDIGWANRKRLAPARDPAETYAAFADVLCEMGRFGRKTGRGFYIYEEGAKSGCPDPEVEEIVAQERARKGRTARDMSAQEIVDRYMAAMANEAARVIEEGIALRPLDVDVTLLNGYGFPRWRGGPMHFADTVGLSKILNDIKRFQEEDAHLWQPAQLLERLVATGEGFESLNSI
ncbi:3-hydroxyacyl-CoA dehydrogenase NAD-binding domain-containing protein [Roseibium sp. RKSG952]|uniref:3-hydroxyacyl-CoA dehydrogenase NAD-binding domain-containing protein n=1 Tax=Roseibium sp. RKSG952 TaxID=2529384 RepID=UPI0012BB772C|nr:3-hydroxyacyl-CoA dehydrogenase NAD-binding domain-containing protein [Roseibium sp. RKSG952]MTH95972.1 3-hydroxyacyl-CoA dehydrogenase [Roseibium sp. RKSG952]